MSKNRANVDLFERITRLDTLDAAWAKVRSNGGCAGGDGMSIEMFQARSAKELILLSAAMRGGRYRPGDYRLLRIDKKGGGTRPLAIPSIIDRVAQTACAATLGPILDATFADGSFGYRPGRGVADAVRAVSEWRKRGYEWVVEADIVRCFEQIPHDPLLDRLAQTLGDGEDADAILDLTAMWIDHAGDTLETPGLGLPQGSPLSPLLCNLWLDGLDDALEQPGLRVVRYADDFVILCKTEARARQALDLAAEILETHALELKSRKTRVVNFDRGFEFLGHLFVRSFALKQVSDSEEDVIGTLRAVAAEDAAQAQTHRDAESERAAQLERGFDPGIRTLYAHTPDRRLSLVNQSFAVFEVTKEEEETLLLSVPHSRVDRIELASGVDVDVEALRHALATGTDIAFVDGRGMTLGALVSMASPSHARLHLKQAEIALDPESATNLARRIVQGRLRTQRAVLKRYNRTRKSPEVNDAALAIGRLLRKLPKADTVAKIMGIEGASGAAYWPALAALTDLPNPETPFTRDRPANDPLDACFNYLTALLGRDVRVAVLRAGLHPGFGVLHTAQDRREACIYDLMEPFRAPLAESVVLSEFNNRRIGAPDFAQSEGGIRIRREARRNLVRAYEAAASRLTASPYSKRRRRWRALMEDAARAYAKHCRTDGGTPFIAPEMKY